MVLDEGTRCMISGMVRTLEAAGRWIWVQIQRFPVPIDEIEYVIQAYGDRAALLAATTASAGAGEEAEGKPRGS